jgi:hypothetical protein
MVSVHALIVRRKENDTYLIGARLNLMLEKNIKGLTSLFKVFGIRKCIELRDDRAVP